MDRSNPYSPPKHCVEVQRYPKFIRMFPTAASLLIGIPAIVIGFAGIADLCYVLFTNTKADTTIEMIGQCSVFLVFGISSLLAARYYWKQKYRHALMFNATGFVLATLLLWFF
jgi:uncharacterized membrane protein